MDQTRRNEIAFQILKHKLRQEGVRLTPNFKREVGNAAKAIGIPLAEALEFSEFMIRELVDEMFAKKKSDQDIEDEGDFGKPRMHMPTE